MPYGGLLNRCLLGLVLNYLPVLSQPPVVDPENVRDDRARLTVAREAPAGESRRRGLSENLHQFALSFDRKQVPLRLQEVCLRVPTPRALLSITRSHRLGRWKPGTRRSHTSATAFEAAALGFF